MPSKCPSIVGMISTVVRNQAAKRDALKTHGPQNYSRHSTVASTDYYSAYVGP